MPWIRSIVWTNILFAAVQKVKLDVYIFGWFFRFDILVDTIHYVFDMSMCASAFICIVDFATDIAIYSTIVELNADSFLKFSYRFNIELDIKWSLPTVVSITYLNNYMIGQIPRWNGALIFFTATFVANMLFVQLLLHIVPRIARKPKTKHWNLEYTSFIARVTTIVLW